MQLSSLSHRERAATGRWRPCLLLAIAMLVLATDSRAASPAQSPRDLSQIKAAGVLRHLGVPYANFVTGSGDDLDVELMQLFAKRTGLSMSMCGPAGERRSRA